MSFLFVFRLSRVVAQSWFFIDPRLSEGLLLFSPRKTFSRVLLLALLSFASPDLSMLFQVHYRRCWPRRVSTLGRNRSASSFCPQYKSSAGRHQSRHMLALPRQAGERRGSKLKKNECLCSPGSPFRTADSLPLLPSTPFGRPRLFNQKEDALGPLHPDAFTNLQPGSRTGVLGWKGSRRGRRAGKGSRVELTSVLPSCLSPSFLRLTAFTATPQFLGPNLT